MDNVLTRRGVEENNVETAVWFLKAAKQGLMASQYQLGVMYRDGCGVIQNDT